MTGVVGRGFRSLKFFDMKVETKSVTWEQFSLTHIILSHCGLFWREDNSICEDRGKPDRATETWCLEVTSRIDLCSSSLCNSIHSLIQCVFLQNLWKKSSVLLEFIFHIKTIIRQISSTTAVSVTRFVILTRLNNDYISISKTLTNALF